MKHSITDSFRKCASVHNFPLLLNKRSTGSTYANSRIAASCPEIPLGFLNDVACSANPQPKLKKI